MLLATVFVLLGIVLLYFGGEALVGSSMRLAQHFGVTPLVIGLTVVAFATSSPELAATLTAALQDAPDIAIGNVIGSNIANLALILGASALIMPLGGKRRFVRREGAFMLVATILAYPMMVAGGDVNRYEGAALVALLLFFLRNLARDPESRESFEETPEDSWPLWRSAVGVALGVVLLVTGAQLLVTGASEVARALGVSERVIGLTIVAFGTSLPELAASIVAARRREGELVLGNLIGSNIFNLLCILGLTSLVVPLPVTRAILTVDYWTMAGVSLLTVAFLTGARSIGRWKGATLLAIYVAYTAWLFVS